MPHPIRRHPPTQHYTFRYALELMARIDEIALAEGCSRTELTRAMLQTGIESYEAEQAAKAEERPKPSRRARRLGEGRNK